MRIRATLGGLGLCFALSVVSSTRAEAVDLEALDWVSRCRHLRERLSAEPGIDVVYSVEESSPPPSWPAVLGGVATPVPPVRYMEVLLSRDGVTGQPTAVFRGPERELPTAIVVTTMAAPQPFDDVFALAAMDGSTVEHPNTRAWTHELFGGAVSHERLIDLGFRHTSTDLSCDPGQWEREIPISIALSLKAIGPGELVAAYQGVGAQTGWVTVRDTGSTTTWEATVLGPEHWSLVSIRLPVTGTAPARLGLGVEDLPQAPDRPLWLDVLVAAMQADDAAGWTALAAGLDEAGLSERSVERAREMAGEGAD